MRALAQRSSEAAKEISSLITSSDKQVRSGVALVSQTGAALTKIVTSVRDISDRVTEIAVSAGEQAGGIAEINSAVNQLDRTTQQTAAMFDRTADSSRALVHESAGLIDAVRIFQLATQTVEMNVKPIFKGRLTQPQTAQDKIGWHNFSCMAN